MSLRYKYKQDKENSQADIKSNELNNNPKKLVASNADYYSEWAVEKCSIEKPKQKKNRHSSEPASGIDYLPTNHDQYY